MVGEHDLLEATGTASQNTYNAVFCHISFSYCARGFASQLARGLEYLGNVSTS